MTNRWQTVETVSDFIFWGSRIAADGDCTHEIKRRLLLGRKVMTNLDSILKSRDITLPTKVHLVRVMAFPVVMYECETNKGKKRVHTHTHTQTHHGHTHTMHTTYTPSTGPDLYFYIKVLALM